MTEIVELAEPIIEVREVVETFRAHGTVLAGWRGVVEAAIAAIATFQATHPIPPAALARIATELGVLLRVGFDADAHLIDKLSAETAEMMSAVVPPTVPGPDDEKLWAFPHA